MPEISLDLMLQTCLAAEGTPLGKELKQVLSAAAAKAARIKSAKGIRLLIKLAQTRGGNPLLPFELDDTELSIASIIIGQSLISGPGRGLYRSKKKLNHARIYSGWSVTQTGFAQVSEQDCQYVTDWAAPLPESGEEYRVFSLRPALRPEYLKMVREAAASRPQVRVSTQDTLRFIFNGVSSVGTSKDRCRCWIINPDSASPQEQLPITNVRLAETPDKELSVEFLRSEAILQLSAAADQNQWLHVQGSELDAVFAIPDILQEEVAVPLWINHKISFPDYLHSHCRAMVDLPQALALACVQHYWWFTIPDKPAMIAAILTSNRKEKA